VSREIAEVGEGRVGHLRIGVGFPQQEEFLASAFAALLKDAPRTTFNVIVSDNDVMVPAMRNGELDLIFNVLPVMSSPDGLVREHLYDDEQVVCASVRHRLAERKRVTLADLVNERWTVSSLVQPSQHRLHEAFRNAGLPPPRIAIESRSPILRLRSVANSDLVDWTSRRFIEQSDLASALKILPVKELAWWRPIGLVYRQESYLPPAMGRFIEIVKASAKGIAHAG
jgi:DNA-binding transcriptional LysR family regulator